MRNVLSFARRGLPSLSHAAARRIGAAVSRLPGVAAWSLAAEEADWREGRRQSGFFGLYDDVESAVAAAPSAALGYDDPAMASLEAMLDADGAFPPMRLSEYAVLFWLRAAIAEGARSVLDIGGHLGQFQRHARRYLDFPPDLRWIVYDVPAVAAAGAARAARDGETGLVFIDDLRAIEGCDVALVAGSLQYLPPGFLRRALAGMTRSPATVLLQRAAISPSRSFVTLQALVTRAGAVRFCPYVVTRRADLLGDLAAMGYRETDAWATDRGFDLPGHPECADAAYLGLRLRREAVAGRERRA